MDDTYTHITVREISAPCGAVWDAWKDPGKIAQWWGPQGFTNKVEELGLHEGGTFRVIMHSPDGREFPNTYVFDEVCNLRRLVYTNQGSDQFGLRPFQSTVEFEEKGHTTKVTLTMRFASQEEKDKHLNLFHAAEGSKQLLERLGAQAGG